MERSSITKIALITMALSLLIAELLYVTYHFQADKLLGDQQLSFWQLPFAYLGHIARLAVVALFIFTLTCKPRIPHYWQRVMADFSLKRFSAAMLAQLASFGGLLYCTQLIFSRPDQASAVPATAYLAWLAFASLTLLFWLLSQMSWQLLKDFLLQERKALLITLAASLLVWALAMGSQTIWGELNASIFVKGTFVVSLWLLSLFFDDQLLYVDWEERLLGLGDFVVKISPACSGYEGIGLMVAFTAFYLFMYRNDLRFPRSFLLFPIGAVVIWFLNSVRINLLVMIGYYWSPDVAVGGFHSQAGWITFILTSMGLLWIAGRSNLLLKQPMTKSTAPALNLPIATLLPLVALLAVTLLSSAFTHEFDYLYPLRVLVVAIILVKVWPLLQLSPYKMRWEAAVAGVLVTVLWIIMLGSNPEANAKFESGLAALDSTWALVWLSFRIIGTIVTVPIAEELAFRAYILCKLSKQEVTTRGELPMVLVAVVGSSLAFGAMHGAWLAGTVAGLIYALVRIRTQHLGDAIIAHGLTNGLLVTYALFTGEWALL